MKHRWEGAPVELVWLLQAQGLNQRAEGGASVAPVGLSSDLQLLGLFGFYYISLKKKFLISKNQRSRLYGAIILHVLL